jgi:hypothetical protein
VKVGDLVQHRGHFWAACGVILYDNDEGGTLKILDQETGKVIWVVKSECEIINESR